MGYMNDKDVLLDNKDNKIRWSWDLIVICY